LLRIEQLTEQFLFQRSQHFRISVFRYPPPFTEMPNFSAATTSVKIFRGMTEAPGGGNFVTVAHSGTLSVGFPHVRPCPVGGWRRTVFILGGVAKNWNIEILKFWNGPVERIGVVALGCGVLQIYCVGKQSVFMKTV
jgi:hypothetical protein